MAALHTLTELVGRLEARGERVALAALTRDTTERLTAAALAARVTRESAALARRGIGRGARVAMFAPPGPAWVETALAVLSSGATLVPVDAQLEADALHHVLRDAEPALVYVTPAKRARIEQLEMDTPPALAELAHDAAEAAADRPPPPPHGEPRPEDDAVLFYTSGTTGPPKGVPLTHAQLCWQIERLEERALVREHDRVLLPLPLHHVYPFVVGMLVPLALGVRLVLPYALTGTQVRRALQAQAATVIIGVPRLYTALASGLEHRLAARGRIVHGAGRGLLAALTGLRRRTGFSLPRALLGPLHRELGGGLRLLASGGAALDPQLAWRFEALGLRVTTGYGLTETGPLLTLNAPDDARLETAGRPLPGVELRIERGEVLARGPAVFNGYWHLPEKTAEAFTDGWFRTGDLGHVDGAGYLHLEGRAATRIVTAGGETLQAEAIETAYAAHPLLAEVAVLEREGGIAALVVPDAGELRRRQAADAATAVREAVRERARSLPSHHRLTEVAVTAEALPRTRLGKLRRHLVRERFERARTGELDAAAAQDTTPLPRDEMTAEDRELLDDAAAGAAWDELAARFPDRRLTPDSDLAGDLGIDSLGWLDLGLAIETRAGIELDEETIGRVTTVRELLQEVVGSGARRRAIDPLAEPEAVLSAEQRRWLEPLSAAERRRARPLIALERAVMRALGGVTAVGLEHLPQRPPFVLAPNHRSYLDAFALFAVLPEAVLAQTHFAGWIGAAFANPLFRRASRLAQAVPIDPAGRVVSSLAFGAAALARGRNLVWFPEGSISRSGELEAFRPGLGRLLARYDVPVVPVWIEGTQRVLPPGRALPRRAPMTVRFGRPVACSELASADADAADERMVAALRKRVAALGEAP